MLLSVSGSRSPAGVEVQHLRVVENRKDRTVIIFWRTRAPQMGPPESATGAAATIVRLPMAQYRRISWIEVP
jgi:hypothetical protein